jgi:hypothetical protein
VSVAYTNAAGGTQTNYPNWEPAPALAAPTVGMTRLGSGQARLQVGGQPGRGYEVQCATNLAPVAWTTADFVLVDGAGATNVTLAPAGERSFFRVR